MAAQAFAGDLGCVWAAGSDQRLPVELDAATIVAPVKEVVPVALAAVRKGGIVVLGGIHMSEIPGSAYRLLWGERIVRSVANLTPIRTETVPLPCATPTARLTSFGPAS